MDDDAVDTAGYIGLFHRDPSLTQNLINITMKDIIDVFNTNNKMSDLFAIIKTVDKDRNGYITNTEFDDILKLIYSDKFEKHGLKNTNLKPVIRQFASSANKVLIDNK